MSIGGELRGSPPGIATRTAARGRRIRTVLLATVGLLVATPVMAHDLADASATLIVRDGGHLQLRLQVPWADVLRAQWMPKASPPEFLAKVVSLPRAEFARDLVRVQATLERDARVVADNGPPVVFARRQWPSANSQRSSTDKSYGGAPKSLNATRARFALSGLGPIQIAKSFVARAYPCAAMACASTQCQSRAMRRSNRRDNQSNRGSHHTRRPRSFRRCRERKPPRGNHRRRRCRLQTMTHYHPQHNIPPPFEHVGQERD